MVRSSNSNKGNNSRLADTIVRDVLAPIVEQPFFPDADEWDAAVYKLMRHVQPTGGHDGGSGSSSGCSGVATYLMEAEVERLSRDTLVKAYLKCKPDAAPLMEVEMSYAVLVRAEDFAGAVRVVTAFLDSLTEQPNMFRTDQHKEMALSRLYCLRAAALEKVGAHSSVLKDCSDGGAALSNVTRTKRNGVEALLLNLEMTVIEHSALQHLGADVSATSSRTKATLRHAIDMFGGPTYVSAREMVERQQRTLQDLQRAWKVYSSPMFTTSTDVSYIAKRRTCPGSVELLLEHLDVLSRDGLYDRTASECERWACEAVKLDDVFEGSIKSRHRYPKAQPAAFLKLHTFKKQARNCTHRKLHPNEVGEAVLRMPTDAIHFYLLALWMEDRIKEIQAAMTALWTHGITNPQSAGAELLHVPTDALPVYLLSLRSMDSCFHQVKDVILKVRNRGEDDSKTDLVPQGSSVVLDEPVQGSAVAPAEQTKPTAERVGAGIANNETKEPRISKGMMRHGVIRRRNGTVRRRTAHAIAEASDGKRRVAGARGTIQQTHKDSGP